MNILPKNTLYYVLLDNQMKHVTSGITAWMFWSRLTRGNFILQLTFKYGFFVNRLL